MLAATSAAVAPWHFNYASFTIAAFAVVASFFVAEASAAISFASATVIELPSCAVVTGALQLDGSGSSAFT